MTVPASLIAGTINITLMSPNVRDSRRLTHRIGARRVDAWHAEAIQLRSGP
jgi:hypothetical protein